MKTITLSLKRHKGKLCIFIFFDYDSEVITLLKKKTSAHWSNSKRAWYLPFTNENKNLLLKTLSKFHITNNIHDNQLDLTEEQKRFLNGYYLFLKGKRYSKSTVKTYTHFIALFVNHYKEKELSTLSNLEVRKFIEDVFLKRNYSISTQRQFISAVKLFCNYYPKCNIKI